MTEEATFSDHTLKLIHACKHSRHCCMKSMELSMALINARHNWTMS